MRDKVGSSRCITKLVIEIQLSFAERFKLPSGPKFLKSYLLQYYKTFKYIDVLKVQTGPPEHKGL